MIVKSVLIFDSGVGGLSVFQEVTKLMPEQHIIYAFDNAAFPYGELPDDVLVNRVCGMITALCAVHEISLVVIACNTASTLVLPPLRERLAVPVVGVVPAIKPAAAMSKSKKIGLLATPATVKRDYTQQLVRDFAPDCQVTMVGSTELVRMGEAKLRGVAVTTSVLESVLEPFIGQVDCVVLGCTHFPLLKPEIETVLGKTCVVVDSGLAIASRVACLLNEKGDLKASFEGKHPHWVFSSASVKDERALNQEMAKLGFSAITLAPIF
ncbi:glutamate racemase [Enterovibrio norvegicus FF-33]|uniref:Glutamate racemase n=1 Tax=Enterovibrio norvegicus FF-454 TaxID=1185651 RepID=A0A1E5CDG1_9GAMM|nr:glutamate racemase [Enterovibrio norvegicus]OEE63477.1 glutamate racemase [Enterovibrio norvegicus FF-454]OEE71133.1 glutamate racemase [Enterovibrio norvegicus FF-33]